MTGPLDIVESRVRNLLLEQADLRERAERAKRRGEEAVRGLLLGVIGVKDAAEAYLAEADAERLRDVVGLLARLLAAQQVEEASAVGRAPDPRWHRVVETVEEGSVPPGTVIREFVKAYLWKGGLLREGQVAVARRGE